MHSERSTSLLAGSEFINLEVDVRIKGGKSLGELVIRSGSSLPECRLLIKAFFDSKIASHYSFMNIYGKAVAKRLEVKTSIEDVLVSKR